MPRLTGYRPTPPDLAERKQERLDAIFRQSIRARDNRTNGEHVNRRDFASYFSSAKEICNNIELVVTAQVSSAATRLHSLIEERTAKCREGGSLSSRERGARASPDSLA